MAPGENPFDKAASAAAAKTDAATAAEQAALMPSWESIKKMLPDPMDQKALDQLEAIVTASTSHNEKVASLVTSISQLGGVVVKLLSRMP